MFAHWLQPIYDTIIYPLNSTLTLTFRPFEIVTLRLRRTDVDDGRTR